MTDWAGEILGGIAVAANPLLLPHQRCRGVSLITSTHKITISTSTLLCYAPVAAHCIIWPNRRNLFTDILFIVISEISHSREWTYEMLSGFAVWLTPSWGHCSLTYTLQCRAWADCSAHIVSIYNFIYAHWMELMECSTCNTYPPTPHHASAVWLMRKEMARVARLSPFFLSSEKRRFYI